jgi:CHAD domain-containing protein
MSSPWADKWIDGVSPDDPTCEVAVRTLQSRLGSVLHYFPVAVEKGGEDGEYLHQLRVWARRSTAALRLYDDFLPRRRVKWIKKQLKRVRRSANDARDCDVFMERLQNKKERGGSKHWLEVVQAERAEAQKDVVALYERLWRRGRFQRRIDQLLKRVRLRGGNNASPKICCFGQWGRDQLQPVVRRFFADVPGDHMDETALHQFRIRGKDLRYAMELLAGAFPEKLRTRLYPVIEAMQDRLGEVNDLATAKALIERRIDKARDTVEAENWRRLLKGEQAQLTRARQKFWAWCTPDLLRELRQRFDALVDDHPARSGSSKRDIA